MTPLPRADDGATDPGRRHAVVGAADDTTISETDWPAYSAGYEAGLLAGLQMTDLRISVELVPVGPPIAGLKLWRALTQAQLNRRTASRRPSLSAQQLRDQAIASWRAVDPSGSGRRVHP